MRMLTVAFAALLALAGCSEMNSSRFRYKMTVEVETPQVLRTVSSVLEISAGRIPMVPMLTTSSCGRS